MLQHELTESYKVFEWEDKKNEKKISKSILIKLLSMNNLVFVNKNSAKPLKSLMEILVSYLKDKFRMKVDIGNGINAVQSVKKTEISNLDKSFNDDEKSQSKPNQSEANSIKMKK